MKIRNTLSKKTAGVIFTAMAVAGLVGLSGPASASEAEGITSTVPQTVESDPYAGITEELESLVGTQSDAELTALATDTQPAELLVDDNNEVIAGYYVEPTFSTFAIGVRGPGCAVGDACAWNGTNNGWYGTGSKYITISGVTRISAGSYTTTFWRSAGNGDFVAANKAITFTSGRAYNQITRS